MSLKYAAYMFWGGRWWDNINDNIILGAIPLHNSNHLELLKKENVGAILSLLENFEMSGTIYFRPISKEEWENNGINFLQIQVEDSKGVRAEDIHKCIMYISENIKNNKKIYVHCKAGRGRSASIVLCYMLWKMYQETGLITVENITQTYNRLKNLRGEISINDNQFITIRDYVIELLDYIKKNLLPIKDSQNDNTIPENK